MTIPTVKARTTLFDAYRTVFRAAMATIVVVPSFPIEGMLALIMVGEAGHLDQSRYHRAVFERWFANQIWAWPELEKWRAICANLSRWPSGWGSCDFSAVNDAATNLRRYTLLMRTIHSRASSLEQANSASLCKAPRTLLFPIGQVDRVFVDIALAETPAAICPLFPGDLSMHRYAIPGM